MSVDQIVAGLRHQLWLLDTREELVAEHEKWAALFGRALMGVLQDDFEEVKRLAKDMPLDFPQGSPWLRSVAIAKARGTG